MDALNLAVVGCGSFGSLHAYALKEIEGARLIAVVDSNRKKARALGETLNVDYRTDYKSILTRSDVDAVVVAVPHFLHKKIAVDCLHAGKHVYLEKPFGVTVEDALAVKKASEESGFRVMPGFSQRFIPSYDTLLKLVEKGELGEPIAVTTVRRTPSKPLGWYVQKKKSGGGILMEWLIHDVYYALLLNKSPVKEVSCMTSSRWKHNIEDTCFLTLKHRDNSISNIWGTYQSQQFEVKASFIGTKGEAEANRGEATLTTYTDGKKKTRKFKKKEDFWKVALTEFIDSLTKDKPFPIEVDDVIKAKRVCEVAYGGMK